MKKTRSTEELMQHLSVELKPVKPLSNMARRFFASLFLTAAAGVIAFSFFSVRSDLHEVGLQKHFIASALALVLGWATSSYSLCLFQTPFEDAKKFLILAVSMLLILALIYLFMTAFQSSHQEISAGLNSGGSRCSLSILALGFLPGTLLFYFLSKGAPTRIALAGFNLGLTSSLLGAFALQFSCNSTLPTHLLVWHLLIPPVIYGLAGLMMARRFLWW